MKMIKRRGRGRGSSDRFRSELLDIEKPFFWDVPMRSANGIGGSIGIVNKHHCLENMSTSWANPSVRCIHSDLQFPDFEPGELH